MTRTRAAIGLLLGVAIIAGAAWTIYAQPIVFCAFLQEDAMDAAFCGTYEKLSNYDEQPEEAVEWLIAYHGEAPSAHVMLGLLEWSTQNQDSFVDILSRLDSESAATFIERLVHAVLQSGQLDQFEKAFDLRKDESEQLRRIFERLELLRP